MKYFHLPGLATLFLLIICISPQPLDDKIKDNRFDEILDMELPGESSKTTGLLESLQTHLGNSAPNCKDMSVLTYEIYNNLYYAVIAAYGDPPLLYLVEYAVTLDGKTDITRYAAGAYALSAGIAPNFIYWDDIAVFWSDIKATRLAQDDNGDWSNRIPNDFTSIQFTMANGEVISYDITSPGVFLKLFPAEHIPVSCELYHANGTTGIMFPLPKRSYDRMGSTGQNRKSTH